ncbi:hypothetical protein GCM10007205_10660 [Oxalicibacterium flavum]|uniref:Alginate biosynthesis protein AlgF n=1 Tax=Oxalicibacterium flavum TaxID=179467 RepID=A0A8J2XXL9_9BURK|nr:alginate O-acetyltransferase AlgF [Oxalicibacterium flavum]GGC03302.1 hypothetical protein GCM10007205_10660 [Oxalicibacterium flavum]
MNHIWKRLLYVVAGMTATPWVMAEGALAQLYAAKPPAGSSFVRVVNMDSSVLQIRIASGAPNKLERHQIVSDYAIVRKSGDVNVTLNGQSANVPVKPGTYVTLVPKQREGRLIFDVLDDTHDRQDGLKATLHFYNLASACPVGRLEIVPSATALFKEVKQGNAIKRDVNPVSAKLNAGCDEAMSNVVELPELRPGDHYSFFMLGTNKKPVLHGQISRTEAFKK